jgi:hypothetical protein
MQSNMKEPSKTAKFLGFSGLIPFVVLTALLFLLPNPYKKNVIFIMLGYGATIVSFLGAIHWGLNMREACPSKWRLVWGVIPSLLGWVSLVIGLIISPDIGVLILVGTLWLCLIMDYKIYSLFEISYWLRLRVPLTFISSLTLMASGIFYFLWKS